MRCAGDENGARIKVCSQMSRVFIMGQWGYGMKKSLRHGCVTSFFCFFCSSAEAYLLFFVREKMAEVCLSLTARAFLYALIFSRASFCACSDERELLSPRSSSISVIIGILLYILNFYEFQK